MKFSPYDSPITLVFAT